MCLFLDCPSDLLMTLILCGVFFVIALSIFFRLKNVFLSVAIFSLLANLFFFLLIISRSLIFLTYHIEWFQYFVVFIWPFFNIYLIFKFFKTKKNENN